VNTFTFSSSTFIHDISASSLVACTSPNVHEEKVVRAHVLSNSETVNGMINLHTFLMKTLRGRYWIPKESNSLEFDSIQFFCLDANGIISMNQIQYPVWVVIYGIYIFRGK
jgi:hypothetical protein